MTSQARSPGSERRTLSETSERVKALPQRARWRGSLDSWKCLHPIRTHSFKTAVLKGPLPACVKSVDRIKKEKKSMRRKKTEKDIQLQICAIFLWRGRKVRGYTTGPKWLSQSWVEALQRSKTRPYAKTFEDDKWRLFQAAKFCGWQ